MQPAFLLHPALYDRPCFPHTQSSPALITCIQPPAPLCESEMAQDCSKGVGSDQLYTNVFAAAPAVWHSSIPPPGSGPAWHQLCATIKTNCAQCQGVIKSRPTTCMFSLGRATADSVAWQQLYTMVCISIISFGAGKLRLLPLLA